MSKNPAVLLLEHHLKELKLPTFLRDYDSVGAVCSQERCDYPTYLLRLAERELIDRERRATERRIKEAAFPVLKTIETFDFAAQPSLNEPLVRELLRGEYISKRENLLLVGNPGTGMFYLGTPNVSPAPDLIPMFLYQTLMARSRSPAGPWEKLHAKAPFTPQPGTYYSATASPGDIVRWHGEFLMFFSASTPGPDIKRTLGIARAKNLEGPWVVQAEPILPVTEQVENSSLYYEPAIKAWFLFTNHIGINEARQEFTDAVWVYWSRDLNRWARDKAVVLDGRNCSWSTNCIGMPSVIKAGKRLALLYDAPGHDSISHMRRDIGLAWLDLPLTIQVEKSP